MPLAKKGIIDVDNDRHRVLRILDPEERDLKRVAVAPSLVGQVFPHGFGLRNPATIRRVVRESSDPGGRAALRPD
jgi:hypothetical protein